MAKHRLVFAAAAALLFGSRGAAAPPLPNTFTAGTPARAAEVNANFTFVMDQLALLVPAGTVLPYAGDTAPAGFLLCDGAAVSRTTYAALFAVVQSRFGAGDGSTTFNLPDLRGMFVRGATNVPRKNFVPDDVFWANGDYLAIPAHGLNRTGFPIRFDTSPGGVLPSPLVYGEIYYAIVLDADQIKVATSAANALAGTAIDLTSGGTGTLILIPTPDTDASWRLAGAPGGASGDAVGTVEDDAFQGHWHDGGSGGGYGETPYSTSTSPVAGGGVGSRVGGWNPHGTGRHGAPRAALETRPRNLALNWIVKY